MPVNNCRASQGRLHRTDILDANNWLQFPERWLAVVCLWAIVELRKEDFTELISFMLIIDYNSMLLLCFWMKIVEPRESAPIICNARFIFLFCRYIPTFLSVFAALFSSPCPPPLPWDGLIARRSDTTLQVCMYGDRIQCGVSMRGGATNRFRHAVKP